MKAFGKALSAAIVAGGAVVTAQAFGIQCPCALSNVDYYGHDVDKLFNGPGTESVASCQKACQRNTYCHYFTYITDRRECYLKDADASRDPKYHATAISGPKYCGTPPLVPGKPPQYPPNPRPPVYVPKPPPPHPVPPPPGKPIPPVVIPVPPTKPPFDIPPLCFRDNIDYYGHDLKKCEGGVAATPLDCQRLCVQERDCAYWTFTRHDKTCYLKTHTAPQGAQTNTNAISGPRVCGMVPKTCFEKDVDYYGCDIRSVEGHVVASPEECQKICQSYADCKYWTWVSGQRNCYLKSGGAPQNRTYSPGSVSGPRICDGSYPPCGSPPKYPPYGGPSHCLDYNVEYVHGTLRTCEAPNLKACQALCRAEPQCEYLTFKLDVLECALKTKYAVSSKAYRKFTYSTSKHCDLNQHPGKYPPRFPPVLPPYVDGNPVPQPPRPNPPYVDGRPVPQPPRPFPPYIDGVIVTEAPQAPEPNPPFLDGMPVPETPRPYPPYIDGTPVPEEPRPYPPYIDGMPVPEEPRPYPPYIDGKPKPELPRPGPAPPTCCELNTDYTGNTIGSTTCHSVATCQRVCQLTAGCHYFSFLEHLKQCNLKGDKGIARPCPGIVSGPETCGPSGPTPTPDVCYHYAVIIGDSIGSDVAYSAPICQNLCMNKPGCTYFTYGLNNGECTYFKNKHSHVPSPFSISGLRACSGGPTDNDWGFSTISPPQVPSFPSKPSLPQPPSTGCVHVDVDFTGNNVGVQRVTTFEACREACLQDDECNCFTYDENTGQCYLKSETGLVHPNRGCMSGLKYCA